jgi:hypothetical protein
MEKEILSQNNYHLKKENGLELPQVFFKTKKKKKQKIKANLAHEAQSSN